MKNGIFFALPEPGEIHLFHVERAGEETFLSQSEKERYASYKTGEVARMFLKGRSALREIAGAYTGKTPSSLDVDVEERGKPYLRNMPDLHFNLSHSGDQLSVAFSREPVGLDLERKERKGGFHELAKRFFHPEECALVEGAGERAGRVFLELWTAKEAMLKLAGKGIAAGLEKARVRENGEGFFGSTRIHLRRFEREDCVGTLASFREIRIVRERTF